MNKKDRKFMMMLSPSDNQLFGEFCTSRYFLTGEEAIAYAGRRSSKKCGKMALVSMNENVYVNWL